MITIVIMIMIAMIILLLFVIAIVISIVIIVIMSSAPTSDHEMPPLKIFPEAAFEEISSLRGAITCLPSLVQYFQGLGPAGPKS